MHIVYIRIYVVYIMYKGILVSTTIAIIFENFYCFESVFCSPQVFEKLIISSRIILDIHVRHSFRDLRLRSLGT